MTAAAAVAATVQRACSSSMVQTVVPEDEPAAANSLLNTVDTITFVIGPAARRLLVLLGAPTLAFGLTAVTFAISAAFLLHVHARSTPVATTERAGTVDELQEETGSPGLGRLLAASGAGGLIGAGPSARLAVCRSDLDRIADAINARLHGAV